MRGQSKRHSVVEALCNTGSGMLIAFCISQTAHELQPVIQKYLWAGFVWNLSAASNAVMTCILTIVSVLRGYCWRRLFNKVHLDSYKEKN